ncbi:MAG: helix-turn-helix domain-containing protein [Patescibacteria group bacterium]|jgi:hypothetical protein
MFTAMTSSLTALGIPPRIAEVYVFLTQHGEVAARDVSVEFALSRATAHDVLSTLVRYGFARSIFRGRERVFLMESPHVIRESFEAERRRAEARSLAFEEIVPNLRALHAFGGQDTGVRYFSGEGGLRDIHKEFQMLPGEIVQLLDYETFCAMEMRQLRDVGSPEVNKHVRSILLTDRGSIQTSAEFHEIRLISKLLFAVTGEMAICYDRVLFLSSEKEFIAIEVRSRAIADVCRATFELAWRAAEQWGRVL